MPPPTPKIYHLPPTALFPNSPHPLLHYPAALLASSSPSSPAVTAYNLFTPHAWKPHWIFRYGLTQRAHYHSSAHEVMAVLSGSATLRFGVADTSPDMEANTWGGKFEAGGVEVQAEAGDVFVLPAGVGHKTYLSSTKPKEGDGGGLELLTPGDGHGFGRTVEEGREVVERVELGGFTMLGAYPVGAEWDFAVGGEEDEGRDWERTWGVEVPRWDPVVGGAREGLVGLWRTKGGRAKL